MDEDYELFCQSLNCVSSVALRTLALNIGGGLFDKLENGHLELTCADYNFVCLSETGVRKGYYDFSGSHFEDFVLIADDNVYATHGLCVLFDKKLKILLFRLKIVVLRMFFGWR